MIDLTELAHLPYFLYGVILAGSACLIFAIASFFEPRVAEVTVRRSASMPWVVTNIGNKLVPSDEHKRSDLKNWLLQAGYYATNAIEVYYGIRVAAAILLPAAVLFGLQLYVALPQQWLVFICIIAAIIGFLAPVLVVQRQWIRRQRKFREGMPDVLDMLLCCTEAGLGIETAIIKVGEEMVDIHPLLAQQLLMLSTELQAGLERREALLGFANRTGIEEAISLVYLLVQAHTFGTSMGQTLRVFVDEMRVHRMLRAEEQVHKASGQLTLVLVACFLPALFAVCLVPAVYSAIKGLHTLSEVAMPW